jgi:O-antigen ligase
MSFSLAQGEGQRLDVVTWLSCYVVLLLFVPSKLVLGPLGSAGAPSMVFGLASLLLWLLFRLGMSQDGGLEAQPVKLALWLFLLSVGISFVIAMARPLNPDEISPADVALLATASWSGTFLVAHDLVVRRERLDTLLWRLVLCAGAIGFLGIVQVLTKQAWVDRVSVPGLTLTEVTGTFTRGAFVRPAGTAVHPIEYGVLITMLLPLAIHMGLYLTSRPILVRWAPAAALAAVVPLTSSRSAYLGAIVGMLVYLAGWPAGRRAGALALALVGVVMMAALTPSLFGSIVGLFSGASEDPSIASRTGSYEVAGVFIDRNPWFGRGLGTFLPKYRIFDNQYLGLLVTVGIVGTVLFLAIAVVAITTLVRLRRSVADEQTRDLSLALAAGVLVGFVGLAMFDAFSFPMTMGALFLLLGAAGALRRLESPRQAPVGDLERAGAR